MSNEAFDRAVERVQQQRAAEAARKAAEEAKVLAEKNRLLKEGPIWAKNLFDKLKFDVLESVKNHSAIFSVLENAENSFAVDIEKRWQMHVEVKERTVNIKTLDADKPSDNELMTAPRYMSLECTYIEEQGWRWKKVTSLGNSNYSIGDMSIGRPIDNSQLISLFLGRLTDLMSTPKR